MALSEAPDTNDVANGAPSSSITVRETKFAPASVTVGETPPTSAVEGLSAGDGRRRGRGAVDRELDARVLGDRAGGGAGVEGAGAGVGVG